MGSGQQLLLVFLLREQEEDNRRAQQHGDDQDRAGLHRRQLARADQAARRFGYDNHWDGQVALAPFRKEWVGLGLKLMLMSAVERGCDAIAWAVGELQQLRYGGELTAVRRLYDQEIPRTLQQLGRHWRAAVGETRIETRRPWLQAVKVKQRWRVTDTEGRFRTQPRYTLAEAHLLISRHSKKTKLAVPMFEIPSGMADWINAQGLPLFGSSGK